MSSTTTTQFYGLTQYIGDDKPDFADNNTAFRNIDADLHQVVQDSQGFSADIAELTETVGDLNTDLTNLSGDLDGEKAKITALQNKELSQDTEISRVERNGQDMITAYNEASATSTHAYAVGDYFIYNNVLYKATAAIAVGATIVPDTNCETTNVASELIQINSDLTNLTKNNFGSAVDVGTMQGTTYVAPSDGYVRMFCQYDSVGGAITVAVKGANGAPYPLTEYMYANGKNQGNTIFVKKGMQIEATQEGTLCSVFFIPLE